MITEIWASFRRMPVWVQIWVGLILAPANIATLFLLGQPWGPVVAALAIGGMLPNMWILATERGLSKLMALPHLVVWTPLVAYLAYLLSTGAGNSGWGALLWAVLIIDLISLGFDYPDFVKWLRGDRKIA